MTIEFEDIYENWGISGMGTDYDFDTILSMADATPESNRRYFVDDIDYQRGHVWTDEQASTFLGALLAGDPMPPVYLQMTERDDSVTIIDGKQRITAIVRWMRGEIPAVTRKGLVVWLKDIEGTSTYRLLRNRCHLNARRVNFNRAQQLAFYIALNSGGTPHAAEEITRVKALLAAEKGA